MKKALIVLVLAVLGFTTYSCRETEEKEKETVIIKEVEKSEDKEGVLERTAKKVDEEVNEEIDKQIEKIGDDN